MLRVTLHIMKAIDLVRGADRVKRRRRRSTSRVGRRRHGLILARRPRPNGLIYDESIPARILV